MDADELVVGPERDRPDAPLSEPDPTRPPGEESRTIGRLADDLVPTLIAHLDASGLGELEVRGQGWRVRLRKPYDRRQPAALGERRHRASAGPTLTRPASAGRGMPASGSAHGAQPHARTAAAPPDLAPSGPASQAPGDPSGNGRAHAEPGTQERAPEHGLDPAEPATSPVVGYFSPRDTLSIGRRVRAGDIVGWVDCLGIRQEVVSPVDGVVAGILAESGEAVEYGQHLVRVVPGTPGASASAAANPSAAAGGAES